MEFLNEQRQVESMKYLLSACSIPVNNLCKSEIRNLFFKTSLKIQGFPIEIIDLSADSIYLNNYHLFRYLVEYEGIPLRWKEIILDSTESRNIVQKIVDSITLVRQYSEKASNYCWNSNFINAFFINSESKFKSGSSSTSVGLSFYCLDNTWSIEKLAESYLHESVHNALFIEDLVRNVFGKQEFLGKENSQVLSPIRKTKRNYDFAFHATCVSIELLKFYKYLNNTKKFTNLLSSTIESFGKLKTTYAKQASVGLPPLTMNGELILKEIGDELESLNVSSSNLLCLTKL